jgi:hypothetical protein
MSDGGQICPFSITEGDPVCSIPHISARLRHIYAAK